MSYSDPKTRFTRKYSPLFDAKHLIVKLKEDRDVVRYHTIQIANHPSPNNIGGSATCPNDKFKKLKFKTNWIILYEVRENLIEFITFYHEN